MIHIIDGKEDFNKAFDDIIKQYHFDVVYRKDSIVLKSTLCKLRLTVDYAIMDFEFAKPDSHHFYSLKVLLYVLYNEKWSFPYNTPQKDYFLNQMLYAKAIILAKFSNVLEGDFSWRRQYTIFERYETNLRKLAGSLPMNDPIKVKYLQDDPSWKVDVKIRFNI